jgi:hypothetical protein
MLTLFQSSLITGFVLSLLGTLLLKPLPRIKSSLLNFPRSKKCSFLFIGIATSWFLWRHVVFLSEADFGNYKLLIGSVALGTAILSFIYVPDFLAVRGLAMVLLLWAREVLDSAFLKDSLSRLFLVTIIYVIIVLSIYFGTWPYKMHEFISWLNRKSGRILLVGWVITLTGITIIILTFTY